MSLFRQRTVLLAQLRAVPKATLAASAALLVLRSLIPAATALATGALVARLVQIGEGHASLPTATAALSVFAAVLLASQLVELYAEPLRYAVVRRVDGAHRRAVERLACAPAGIAHLEDPSGQDDLLTAAGDPDNWTEGTPGPAAWSQMVILSRYVGGLGAIVVIARDSVPVALFLLASLLGFRSVQRRGFLGVVRAWVDGMAHRRRANYWTSLLTGSQAAKEIRVFGFGEWVQQRHREDSDAHLQPFRVAKLADARRQWYWLMLVLAAVATSMYVLGALAVRGHLSIGRLSADITAAALVLPMFSVSEAMLNIESGLPRLLALHRLRQRWTAAGTTQTPIPAPPPPPGSPAPLIRFEGVHFAYPNREAPVLDGLDLDINPGEVLALVGLNGAGKTTIIKLLAGLYQPDAGRITVDGVDLDTLGVVAWRRQLSIVFQDFLRYQLSMRDNIALGQPDAAGPDDILGAAKDAGITAIIEDLPNGWETPLSRNRGGGVDLSGGQWQRIALARALLPLRVGARVMVLDEPTAHLDVRTELEVFRQVVAAARGASVLLVSHRLSTVRQADRIVLLEHGRVVESGSHDALMATDGVYASLFRLQAQHFVDPTHGRAAASTAGGSP